MGVIQKLYGLFLALSCGSIGMGFYKMFAYKNSEYFKEDNVNAVVGGDAYNYIINSERATAWFVLALMLVLIACAGMIMNKMDEEVRVIGDKNETTDCKTV